MAWLLALVKISICSHDQGLNQSKAFITILKKYDPLSPEFTSCIWLK